MTMLFTILFTVLGIAFIALCSLAAWQAQLHATACAKHAALFAAALGRLQSVESGHESLLRQHNSLRAKFYKTLGPPPSLLDDVVEPVVRGVANRAEECENWRKAQHDGPHSLAAGCVCDYCELMRLERARRKEVTLPKSLIGKIEVARKGAGQQ